jgi:hypothetical protein
MRRERNVMNILKPVFLSAVVFASVLGNIAAATERPPRVGEERIVPKKPGEPTPATQVPAKKPVKRRAVRQVLDDDVRPAAPPVVYAPTLTPPPARSTTMPAPAPSSTTVNCVGGSCVDPAGNRYNGGVGSSVISPQGRLCSNNGMTVQCF